MALTGIAIFKMLPKTNCAECGVPTCMAFAMKLAQGQAELDSCPYVSDEARAALEEASAPPIRPLTIGTGEGSLKIGGETVLFRHEKTFVNPPGIAVLITDEMSDAEVDQRLERLNTLQYVRVGVTLKADLAALKCTSGNADSFAKLVERAKEKTQAGFILMADDPHVLREGLKPCADRKPLLYAASPETAEPVAALAKEAQCPVAARAEGIQDLVGLTTKLTESGLKDIVIDAGSRSVRGAFEDQILLRRAAIEQKHRPLGFPTITFPCEMTDNPMKEALLASMFIAKYGSIIVLSDLDGSLLFPLLVQRLNIYTDPQRPMATSQGIYEIGGPDENSPVLITSNFSLTYFIVSGEIETSRVPAWLLVIDTEGLSVLTAWAAGKFVGDAIGIFVKKSGVVDKIKHRKIIIPGYSAAISGDLEEELGSDWEVQIGPREAAHIPAFLKMWSPNGG
ncbi:MAG: acetyl-CoA decarbonylase/synthase complex subunit gamma [Deltaproteobacteria bacterium]|nr:acetyl-CoA decarbonylase/synthase complex subunit gamma [Deltaproteobacteria bacterium]